MHTIDVLPELLALLDDTLGLAGGSAAFTRATPLLGSPHLDSMAAVALITGIEERFGLRFDGDEVRAEQFATVGALAETIERRLGG